MPSPLAEHYVADRHAEHAGRRAAARGAGRRRPTRRCSTRNCVYQILRRHYAAYTPEMVERVTGCPQETFLKVAEAITAQLGPRADRRLVLRRRLDPAHDRRADDPRLRDHPAAARQHRPAGRRHPGAARPHQHPGQHRHPDALQPAARLPAPAERAEAAQDARGLPARPRRRRPAGGTTSRSTWSACCGPGTATRATAENELGLRLGAEDHRRPLAAADDAGDPRRHDPGPAADRPEPGRRRPQHAT